MSGYICYINSPIAVFCSITTLTPNTNKEVLKGNLKH